MSTITTQLKPRGWSPRTLSNKSLVVPDQTLSLKTMVQKYVRGLPISAPQFNGIGTDDELAIDFKKLDLAEQEEITNNALDELKLIDDTKTRQMQDEAAKRKEKAEKDLLELEELRKLKETYSSKNT
jgi:hypothetical protein